MTAYTASTQLPETPSSARIARGFIADTLVLWECDAVVETTELLASELVTNAVLHARTPITLEMSLTDRRLRVEVCDHSEQMPVVRPYDIDAGTGRGLAMVSGYAAAWGSEARPGGKCVWFEIDT